MENNISYYQYKMVIFGNQGVGKTSLINRFINDKFDEIYTNTLGYNVFEKILSIDKIQISLMIFDFAGQKQFETLRSNLSKLTDMAFLVYDVTDKNSFKNLSKWKSDLFEFSGEIPFIIIGNKMDMTDKKKVTKEEGEKISKKLNSLSFFETSAKTGDFIEDSFLLLVKHVLERHET